MKKIQKLSQELQEKSTWLKKGVKDILSKWKEATEDEVNDESLQYVVVFEITGKCGDTRYYFIERGYSSFEYCSENPYSLSPEFESGHMIYFRTCDISKVKLFISNFPKALEEYRKKLEDTSKDYDEVIEKLKKEFNIS